MKKHIEVTVGGQGDRILHVDEIRFVSPLPDGLGCTINCTDGRKLDVEDSYTSFLARLQVMR